MVYDFFLSILVHNPKLYRPIDVDGFHTTSSKNLELVSHYSMLTTAMKNLGIYSYSQKWNSDGLKNHVSKSSVMIPLNNISIGYLRIKDLFVAIVFMYPSVGEGSFKLNLVCSCLCTS